ncbi:MAG: DUF3631 domain-containing protein [Phycisphaerales bacterium]|nr:DUF3631 domain-containing protein [Phycisphaerales bacterium]
MKRERFEFVCPGLFIAHGLAGTVVQRLERRGDSKPSVVHRLVYADADRKRHLIEFLPEIAAADGFTLLFDPKPPRGDPRCTRNAWSPESIDAWVGGTDVDPNVLISSLIDKVKSAVWHHADVSDAVETTIALWIMLTFVPAFDTVPYLHASGSQGCGKTVLLHLLGSLVHRPLTTSSGTGPSIFRSIHSLGCTFLLDEAELLSPRSRSERASDVMEVLLSGYKRGSPAIRCSGESHDVKQFDLFGPKAIACIETLPPTLASRCITIPMARKPPNATLPQPLHSSDQLRDNLYQFALTFGPQIAELASSNSTMNGTDLANREADLFGPLLTIAKFLEERGAHGMRERVLAMTELQRAYADDGEEVDLHREVFRSLHRLRKQQPKVLQAKDILHDLRNHGILDADVSDSSQTKIIGNTLRTYGVVPATSGGKRTYHRQHVSRIEDIMNMRGWLDADDGATEPALLSGESSKASEGSSVESESQSQVRTTGGLNDA